MWCCFTVLQQRQTWQCRSALAQFPLTASQENPTISPRCVCVAVCKHWCEERGNFNTWSHFQSFSHLSLNWKKPSNSFLLSGGSLVLKSFLQVCSLEFSNDYCSEAMRPIFYKLTTTPYINVGLNNLQ